MKRTTSRSAFTLVEVALAATILVVVLAGVAQSVAGMRTLRETGEVRADLQIQGGRMLRRVLEDLKQTGFAAVGGSDYPHLFDNGIALNEFAAHAHPPAAGRPGEPLVSREIVFLRPRDADQDGVPDLGVDGSLVWDPAELTFVLVPDLDGTSRLERRIDAANPRTIGRHVERVVFDDALTSGFEIPLDCLRVRIELMRSDRRGQVYRHVAEGVVRAMNGGILQ